VLFYALPDARTATLRRLVRLVRQARVEPGACQARFRNTFLPPIGPAGEPLSPALVASLPAPLRRLCPAPDAAPGLRGRPRWPAPGCEERGPGAGLPPGLASELTDVLARLSAVQAQIAQLEAALVPVAEPLPAYALLQTIPRVGPTVAAILLAELRGHRPVQPGQSAPQPRGAGHPLGGDGPVDRDGGDLEGGPGPPALGPLPGSPRRPPHSGLARAALIAKRKGDRHAFFEAVVGLAAKLLRVIWGVWRSGTLYDPTRAAGLQRQGR
jgi:hypothetical protein